jgi:hypothetical protein
MDRAYPDLSETIEFLLNPAYGPRREARIACRMMDEGADPGVALAEAKRISAKPVEPFNDTISTLDEEDAALPAPW